METQTQDVPPCMEAGGHSLFIWRDCSSIKVKDAVRIRALPLSNSSTLSNTNKEIQFQTKLFEVLTAVAALLPIQEGDVVLRKWSS